MNALNRLFRLVPACLLAVGGSGVLAQNVLTVPAPAQAGPVVLVNAHIHPVASAPIEGGRLRFEAGRIVALGGDEVSLEAAMVVDLAGRRVYPGLVAANTVMGLVEVETARGTVDLAEVGELTPNVRAEVAINPDSELIPVARANGVLTALSRPLAGSGGLISGRSALIQLDGWTWEAMTVRAPIGLHIDWPGRLLPQGLADEQRDTLLKAQDEKRKVLERAFEQAAAYRAARVAGPIDPPDLRWEAMLPVLAGELPAMIHADDAESIESALDFARRHGLRMILVGGLEAWKLTALLAAQDVPVIIAGTHVLPLRRSDPEDAAFANPGKLHAAGIRFAIASPGDAFNTSNERNLPYQAASAVAHGLPAEQGLRAVTLYPAQILGVADRLGSLEVGKDATFFVADGDPLETATQVERAWIGGREIDLANRHRQLHEKYLQKYAP